MGVDYVNGWRACGLALDDFFPLDGHPNASGYEKIRRCVLRSLARGPD